MRTPTRFFSRSRTIVPLGRQQLNAPASECAILKCFNEQGAEAYGVAPSASCLESRLGQLRVLAGAWRPVLRHPLWKGRFLQQTSPLRRRQTLPPERMRGAWVGLRPFPADGVYGLRWKRSATRRLIHHYGLTAALAYCPGDGPAGGGFGPASARPGGVAVLGGGAEAWRRQQWLLRERGRPVRCNAERFSPARHLMWRRPAWFPSSCSIPEFPHTRD